MMIAISKVQQTRVDLTAALRWACRHGLNEGVCNHFSMEIPGESNRFLINPQGLHWSEITPADLVVVDSDGTQIEGRHRVEPTAFFIHGRIHKAGRKQCVMHTHMPYATALTVIRGGRLSWCNQNTLRFFDRVAYDEQYNGVALSDAEGDRIAAALGDADVLFLASHGVVVCGPSIAYAYDDLYYLERSCMVQVLAQGTGQALRSIPSDLCRRVATEIGGERQQSDLHFEALKRLLDRDEPGWSSLE